MKPDLCVHCKGRGEYSFPEASGTDMSDGWYGCEYCEGTGKKARSMIKLINKAFEDVCASEIGEVNLIISDMPDNIGLKYQGFKDKTPNWEYEFNIMTWLQKMKKLTNGPIFFTFNQMWTREIENIIHLMDIKIIQRLQWYFTFGQNQTSKGKYALCYRPLYWLGSDYVRPEEIKVPSARQEKYHDKRAAKGGKMPNNVFEFSRVCGTFRERRKWTPTQLPEALVERIVRGHCRPNGHVLDPFLGSGTTAIICQRLGIDCTGIEISKATMQNTAQYLGVDYQ